jgi:hypothetical protein
MSYMSRYRVAVGLSISILLSISIMGQTRPVAPVQSKPLPSHPVSGSKVPVAGAQPGTVTPSLPQPLKPAQTLPSPASPAPTQNASAPINGQAAGLPQSASGTVSVEYRNGLLSVVTDKADLGKVLQVVGSKIGTSIEVAPEIASDPVVAHISPAPPTQVLAQLLDGPQLEYIVMASDEGGQSLNRVVVRRRSSFGRQPLIAIKTTSAVTHAPGTAK